MKNNVLFITEKYCDGNPDMGLTNHYHNLFDSLQSTNLYSSITIAHFDEIYSTYNRHFDDFTEGILDEYKPDTIIVSHLGASPLNPTVRTYHTIKKRNIKLVFMWPDTREWVYNAIRELYPYSDLHVSWGCERDDNDTLNDKHMWLWAPQNPALYFDDKKTIDVSFIGTLNGYNNIRLNYIQYLVNNKVPINFTGGQREEKLSVQQYAEFVRKSKINLNFSVSAEIKTHQCKGRVFEILASNSLLLESENYATKRRLTPGTHYIEFSNESDLKDKIEYFLKNESERIEKEKNELNIYNEKYTATSFWSSVFERIK